ncbi:hypothetical protein HOLleu_10158 [Holothuria leucospilota]|uniref:DUF7869 domain-containing protein n=1 Tax=Holothuria leucospilota TaxID=206669 RepID=A0A9Q1CEH5_HOLLE|nr:hypothetical protein HOLleu_10158 [Holothuria leucospilota]
MNISLEYGKKIYRRTSFQRLERKAYHDERDTARREPTELTCMILDGMDQSKTNVPHFIVLDKDNTHLAQLPVHFTGVLVHTGTPEGKIPLIFYDLKQVPHDSNLTIHCLIQALLTAKAHLGKVLFLQLDNCFRENKNKYVLSFAALMVELKIFKEVYVHFLPVGHTHEDVDQMFSCVPRHLRSHNAYTLPDLLSEPSASYHPPITMLPVKMVQNAKAVLANIMTLPNMTRNVEYVDSSLEKADYDRLVKELPHAYSSRLPVPAKEWWSHFIKVQMKEDYEKRLYFNGMKDLFDNANEFNTVRHCGIIRFDVCALVVQVPPKKLWILEDLILEASEESTSPTEGDEETLAALKARIENECPDVHIRAQGKTKMTSVNSCWRL